MIKKLLTALLLVTASQAHAQNDTTGIKNAIGTFFEGMHTWDTTKISSSLDSSIFFYSIMNTKAGTRVEPETKEGFFGQVVSLNGKKYEERLLSYDIRIDGSMAVAWTPYQFYFEGKFSHCGVNVFTLVKRGDSWKILGITDTRRRQGCN